MGSNISIKVRYMWPLRKVQANVTSVRGSADRWNTIMTMLDEFEILPSPDGKAWIQAPQQDGKGWKAYIPYGPATYDHSQKHSFDLLFKTIASGSKPVITILEGYINIQGETPVLVVETDIELERFPTTADATYIYLEMPDGGVAQVLQQIKGVRPKSVPGTWRKILYELYVDSDDFPVITWDRRLDFDIGSPI